MKEKIYKIAVNTKLIYFWRFLKMLVKEGPIVVANKIAFKILNHPFVSKLRESSLDRKLNRIIETHEGQKIILSLSSVDWKVPLFQRPQHIATQLSELGYLYFYHTHNHYDNVDGYKKIGENMYLTNRFDDVFEKLKDKKKYIHVSNNMYEEDEVRIDKAIENGDKILYEYWDEISPEISGREIPEFVLNRHERLLKDEENCYVVATANKLYNDVAEHRKRNFKLVTNGVVYEHFRDIKKTVPKEITEIVASGKPILGYYGALASWFDYEVIKEVAKKRPDWNILLIGWDYDGTLEKSGLKEIENVYILGPVDYKKLPFYAQWFDVSTIPFKINKVTESTSPVKLFEYMALGKPIVTTPMPECKKYESVLIAENRAEDFIAKVEKALTLSEDKEYLAILEKEGMENTWRSKAEDIVDLISN